MSRGPSSGAGRGAVLDRGGWRPSLPRRAVVTLIASFLAVVPTMDVAAEKGALTFEAAAAAQGTAITPPKATPETESHRLTVMPHGRIAARYALTHDVGIGLSVGAAPRRWVTHEDAVVSTDLEGRLVHTYSAMSVTALARLYLRGYDYRAYIEPAVGLSRRRYGNLDHLAVLEDGTSSYGLNLEPYARSGILVGAGMGLEHVWDRSAVGARIFGAAILDDEPACQARLVIYVAYDLYP